MTRTAIAVEGLRKAYGNLVAVDGLSFDVAEGEIFGLLGPNGSGKTTTVECLQGLRRADAGRLSVLGFDPRTQRRELRRRIGTQLQESALPERIKVWEAARLFASLTPGAVDWETLLQQWGLVGKRSATFGSLSGGQRQRLFVALALINRPEVVFLDEMTTGLDPAARREAWSLITSIRDQGATVVLVTHFMDEAERLCDRVAVVRGGQVVATGTPQELIARESGVVQVSFTAGDERLSELQEVPGVQRVVRSGARIDVYGSGPLLARIGHALVSRGLEPADLRVHQPTLEDVYLKLTSVETAGGEHRAHPGGDDLDRAEAIRP